MIEVELAELAESFVVGLDDGVRRLERERHLGSGKGQFTTAGSGEVVGGGWCWAMVE